MNKKRLLIIVSFAILTCMKVQAQDIVSYVQPLSGTAPATTKAALKHGNGTELNANTIPAVGLPFAMTQWTAQTRQTEVKCQPPYFYKDSLLSGFRGTHWLSGSCTQDYGSFTIMPISGTLRTLSQEYQTPFSHKEEVAAPHYYRASLPGYNLLVEMTGTLRCGFFQITAQKADSVYLLITPNSDQEKGFVKVDQKKGLIWGYNPAHRIYQGWGKPAGFSGYFVLQIDRGFSRAGTYRGKDVFELDSLRNGKNIGAFVGFTLKAGEKLRVRVGTSFSSIEGALRNLQAEVKDWDFEALTQRNKKVWLQALGQIKVEGKDVKSKKIFYTSVYHTMQHPRLFNDVDGTYPEFSGNYKLNKIAKGSYYDDFSMWDIYRAHLPLFEILQPELINSSVRSMVLKGQQGGWLPIFPCWNSYTAAMIGDHVTAFIASAFVKGIRDYDQQEAYRLMRQNAFAQSSTQDYKDGKGRRALESYLRYGYIPMEDSVQEAFHKKEQVSRTLEYAFDDYALAKVAEGLNKKKDHKALIRRSLNYRNVFDPAVNMVRGRFIDKSWYQPFNASHKEPYITEGTPQQYTFYAPHDVKGLASLMGGANILESSLDKLFNGGEYWHGNEPGHQIPFMYNYTPSPWKAQLRVKQILEDEYGDGPGGLSGNDDAGQMSAWYVFSALGFYPLNPVSDQYMLTSPLFDSYNIILPGAKSFKVVARRSSPESGFISSVKFNGKPYFKNYLSHRMITDGGLLEIFLSDKPNKNWATKVSDQAKSLSK
ncbi:GH92 family glycosyl hydrolase [Desertivirga brevis]|uniref:GH92 family glycosyl hydrolase n=1 Tax=Desertivirga brevis TaxID=2810310 RepID=UPI0034E2C4F8